MHEYYQYDAQQLMAAPKIPLQCMADNETVFRAMIDIIQAKAAAGQTCLLICPVGPVGQ